jgi:hypothetical protein
LDPQGEEETENYSGLAKHAPLSTMIVLTKQGRNVINAFIQKAIVAMEITIQTPCISPRDAQLIGISRSPINRLRKKDQLID